MITDDPNGGKVSPPSKWTREYKKAYMAAYWLKNRARLAASYRAWRAANPEIAKMSSASWAKANPELAKAASHAYYNANREALVVKSAKWKAMNPEKQRATKAVYNKKNADRIVVWKRAHYYATRKERLAHSVAYRLAHPEQVRAAGLAWQKANPHKTAAYRHKRRALKYGNSTPGQIESAKTKIRKLMTPPYSPCCYCDTVMPSKSLSIEHILALHRGGAHSAENITLACKKCNSSKHNKLLYVEWFPKNYTKEKADAYLNSGCAQHPSTGAVTSGFSISTASPQAQ